MMKTKFGHPGGKQDGEVTGISEDEVLVPRFWVTLGWLELINMKKPNFKLDFETGEDWVLYEMIAVFAKVLDTNFHHAAHWVLRLALGDRFDDARQMLFAKMPWDPDVRFVCRVVSLQICKYEGPNDCHELGLLDHMLPPLLTTDDECLNYRRAMKFIRG